MPRTSTGLKRIAELYSALEKARSAELQRAIFLTIEVEQAIGLHNEVQSDAKSGGRTALEEGDKVGWLVAEGRSALADWSLQRLKIVARERHTLRDAASEQYRASRIESKQVGSLLEASKREAAIVEGRRAQATADDRFLSRRQWRERRDLKSNQAFDRIK